MYNILKSVVAKSILHYYIKTSKKILKSYSFDCSLCNDPLLRFRILEFYDFLMEINII